MSKKRDRCDDHLDISSFLENIVDHPELFLTPSENCFQQVLEATQVLYNFSKQIEPEDLGATRAFKTLFVAGLNEDQIWEELQLQNKPLLQWLNRSVSALPQADSIEWVPNKKKKLDKTVPQEPSSSGDGLLSNEDEDGSLFDDSLGDEDIFGSDSDEGDDKGDEGLQTQKGSDTDFFSYKSMEKFIAQAERAEEGTDIRDALDSDDEEEAFALMYGDVDDFEEKSVSDKQDFSDEIDAHLERLLDDMEVEEDEPESSTKKKEKKEDPAKFKYDDWFAPQGEERFNEISTDSDEGIFDDEEYLSKHEQGQQETLSQIQQAEKELLDADEGSEEEEEDTNLSAFQMQQKKKQEKIKKIESANLETKSWQMSGEVRGVQRPLNSLLAEDLDFETTGKIAPVITEQVTRTLEEMIKYRISEKAFDDPIRKTLDPKEKDHRRSASELDGTKSKKSLAEIYEDEWKAETTDKKDEEDLNPQYAQLSSLFKFICEKLDAMSNFSFVPRKQKDEVDVSVIKKDASAITMEEVTPITVSDAARLGPEEIYQPPKNAPKGESELTREDRKKNRSHKKEVRAKKKQNQPKKSPTVQEKKDDE